MTQHAHSAAAVELVLYAENDSACYHAYLMPMMAACQKHYDRGQGNYERMIAGFTRAARSIAKQYALEHCSMTDSWADIFPVSVRREFAEHFADYFLTEYRLGHRVSTQIAPAAAGTKSTEGNTHD